MRWKHIILQASINTNLVLSEYSTDHHRNPSTEVDWPRWAHHNIHLDDFICIFGMGCSCLISEWMLIQGTNQSEIPEPELCVCWENSWRRAWDSGKGEVEVLPSWMEPGDFTNFPLFLTACFSSWRTVQFQWCIFLTTGLLSQECWAAGTALPAAPQPCFIHHLILLCPWTIPALPNPAPPQKEPVDGSPGLQKSCKAEPQLPLLLGFVEPFLY